jgi:hypothetical protein
LEFPTHHADTSREAGGGFDPFTQFDQADIGLLFHFGAEQVVPGREGARRAAGVGQRGATARVALAIPPLFEGGLMDAEARGHFAEAALAGFNRSDGPIA